jgi:SWI/SNF-related matrix-associated actin-dependent regulator of chromatin subfamily D
MPSNAFPLSMPGAKPRNPATPTVARGPATPTLGLKPTATANAAAAPQPAQHAPFVTLAHNSRHLDRSSDFPEDIDLPDFEAYRKLMELEAKTDYYLQRAQLKLQQAVSDPRRSIYTSPRILRFTVTNTHEGQPIVDGKPALTAGKEPAWSIRLSGRLLDNQGNIITGPGTRKMSSFFKQIVVQLDRAEFPTQWNIAWNRSRSTDDVDTFTFTHKSKNESTVNIFLTLAAVPSASEAISPTPALREALGLTTPTYSKQDLLILMWRYIRSNGLQDPMRKSSVRCNEALKGIFDLDSFEYDELPDLLQSQLMSPDPIHIPYTIRFCKDSKDAEVVFDIPVELDVTPLPIIHLNSHQSKISEVNRYVTEHLERVGSKKRKRDFYLDFASDPVIFMHEWSQSQKRDLAAMAKPPASAPRASSSNTAETGVERELEVLPSTTFQQPLATVAVHSYLSHAPHRIPQIISHVSPADEVEDM